jgi:hypothetical protein
LAYVTYPQIVMLSGGFVESALTVLTSPQNSKIIMTRLIALFDGCQTIFSHHNHHSM